MIRHLTIGISLIILVGSCNQKTAIDNKVALCRDFNIVVNAPDTLGQDQDLFASIHISNPKYKLLFAHYDCNVTDTISVDTTRLRLIGCHNNLVIENDSVKIGLHTGNEKYQGHFPEVTLLAKGLDNKYYYQKCSFDYYVK